MRIVLIISVVSFLFFSCKKNTRNEKFNLETPQNQQKKLSESEELYNLDNFKDNKKRFNLFGENYDSRKKTFFLNDIFYTAAIIPKEYFLKKHNTSKENRGDTKTEEVVLFDFQHLDQQDLLLKKANGDYKKYVEYMAFKIKKDFIAITVKGDTIKPNGVLFERTFKLTPYKRVLLFFNFKYKVEEFKLVYNDQLFGNETIKFNLKK